MLGRFLKESGITHVLGITATPVKLQTNRDKDGQNFSKLVMLTSRSKKGNFFKDIIHVGQVAEMVRLGFWSPLQYETAGFDSSLLVFNSSKSEYTEESVQRAYDANGGSEQIVQALDRHSAVGAGVYTPHAGRGEVRRDGHMGRTGAALYRQRHGAALRRHGKMVFRVNENGSNCVWQ